MNICKICSKSFYYPSGLQRHLDTVICKSIDKKSIIQEHQLETQKKYQCSLCEKEYSRKDFFKKHVDKCKQKLIEENKK